MRCTTNKTRLIEILRTKQQLVGVLLKNLAMLVIFSLAVAVVRQQMVATGVVLNADEAELMAWGSRATKSLHVPFGEYPGTTVWFLWPVLLGFLGEIGIPLDLRTAHLLANAAYIFLAWVMWNITSRSFGVVRSALMVLPTFLFIVSSDGDFLSLGTELLPITLISIACFVALSTDQPPTPKRILVANVLLGSALWAKPQVSILAAATALNILLLIAARRGDRSRSASHLDVGLKQIVIYTIGGFALPTIVFVTWIYLSGSMDEFVMEPLSTVFNYSASSTRAGGVALHQRPRIAIEFMNRHLLMIGWSLIGLFAFDWGKMSRLLRGLALLLWMGPLLAAYFTMMVAVPPFDHYLNIFICASAVSGISVLALSRWSMPTGMTRLRLRPNSIAMPVFGLLLIMTAIPALSVAYNRMLGSEDSFRSADINALDMYEFDEVASACPSGERVQVWGWSAELYSYYGWFPATRYPNNHSQIFNHENPEAQQFSRDLFAEEIEADAPDCILEALGEEFFASFDEESSLTKVIPRLGPVLRDCYVENFLELADGRRARVWTKANC